MSDRCPRCDSTYCCGVDYAEELLKLKAERDRLRDQNADLLGQLDAVVFAYNGMARKRDRLRRAIKNHRRDMWGGGRTDHQQDNRLYAALREEEG